MAFYRHSIHHGQQMQQRTGRRFAVLSVRCGRILASASTNNNQHQPKKGTNQMKLTKTQIKEKRAELVSVLLKIEKLKD